MRNDLLRLYLGRGWCEPSSHWKQQFIVKRKIISEITLPYIEIFVIMWNQILNILFTAFTGMEPL